MVKIPGSQHEEPLDPWIAAEATGPGGEVDAELLELLTGRERMFADATNPAPNEGQTGRDNRETVMGALQMAITKRKEELRIDPLTHPPIRGKKVDDK